VCQSPERTDRFGDPLPSGALARLGSVRLRHVPGKGGQGDGVSWLAFAPDGLHLASASEDDATVRVWDLQTSRQLAELTARHVRALAFAPAANTLLLASGPSDLVLFDGATGKERVVLRGHQGRILAAAFAPDGKTVLAAAGDRALHFWDVATGAHLRQLATRLEPVHSIALAGDTRTLASAGNDRTVRLWNAADGKQLREFREHTFEVQAVALSPDGRRVASADPTTVIVWDASSGKELFQAPSRAGRPGALAFSPDGKLVAAGSGAAVRLWDTATAKPLRTLEVPSSRISSVAFSRDGQRLAAGTAHGTLHVWEVATGTEWKRPSGHIGPVPALAFSPDGRSVATLGDDNTWRLWDAATGAEQRVFGNLTPDTSFRRLDGSWAQVVFVLAFAPDGKTLATRGSGPNSLFLWDLPGGSKRLFQPQLTDQDKLHGVAFTPDGKALAVGGYAAALLVDVSTGKPVRTFAGQGRDVLFVAVSPDGARLVSSAQAFDSRSWLRLVSVCIWDMASGKKLRQINLEDGEYGSFTLAPDGKTFTLFGGSDLQLWETATGKLVRRFLLTEFQVRAAVLSPDGRTLAAAVDRAPDQTELLLLETSTGEVRGRLGDTQRVVTALAFAPDGRRLASASTDAPPLVWDASGVAGKVPAADELKTLWSDLGSGDAERAHRAVWLLAAAPRPALTLLGERLRPAAADTPPTVREELAQRRAVEVLEHVNTAQARQLLTTLATGRPEAPLTQEAKASLERLARRLAAVD
jgi:WD40 repeat protein